ncbi:porin family protein [Chitinophaga rhizophila]|uniref:Porin family protein n=1 Tax=Chitinophaga rhizophila TaxID=2866212 RepID=A0ABS7GCC9_9BACT|nr:porin family protein [Chitinophaga rhizophila]MBW8684991.1 porin family protein [Chitinophaga rhizophila]
MQLLDDDMDELFRKAASDYPLNTGAGDWDAMRNKLQQADNSQQGTATRSFKDRWWFRLGIIAIITATVAIVAISVVQHESGKRSAGNAATPAGAVQQQENAAAQASDQQGAGKPSSVTDAQTNVSQGDVAETSDKLATEKQTAAGVIPEITSQTGNELPEVNKKATNTQPVKAAATEDKQAVIKPEGKGEPSAAVNNASAKEDINTVSKRGGKKSAFAAENNKSVPALVNNHTVNMPANKVDVTKGTSDNKRTGGYPASLVKRRPAGINAADIQTNHIPAATPVQTAKTERTAGDAQTNRDIAAVYNKKDKERAAVANSEQLTGNRNKGNIAPHTRVTGNVPASSYPAANQGITAVYQQLYIEKVRGVTSGFNMPAANIKGNVAMITLPANPTAQTNASAETVTTRKNAAGMKSGFYYGAVLSPDLTTVKMQRTAGLGYNVGLIAGYTVNKQLSIETGILYERKYYYSVGKYFDAKNTNWPPYMTVFDIDGWCNMYEIPLNVRYTFAKGVRNSWYVNAGVSSYIMKTQQYDYSYEYYGEYGKKNWTYHKATADWFSIIHLGVGYERPIGVLGTLRLEPYIKIPTRGIGVGNLPVTSAGLNIGLTRPLRLK